MKNIIYLPLVFFMILSTESISAQNNDSDYVEFELDGTKYKLEKIGEKENNAYPVAEGSKDNQVYPVAKGLEYRNFDLHGSKFRMVKVEGGTFKMGAQYYNFDIDNYDVYAMENELPVHKVTLSDYYMAEYELTCDIYRKAGCEEGYGIEYDMPIRNITRDDALHFIDNLNKIMHDNGQLKEDEHFTFPTEAQWEYAAKGGRYGHGTIYAGSNDYKKVCYCRENSTKVSFKPVGSFAPNELGLYDMSGNMIEFCLDHLGDYSDQSQNDPQEPAKITDYNRYATRGGSYYTVAKRCRVTHRHSISSTEAYNSHTIRLCLVKDKK